MSATGKIKTPAKSDRNSPEVNSLQERRKVELFEFSKPDISIIFATFPRESFPPFPFWNIANNIL